MVDPDDEGLSLGWHAPSFDDFEWQTTDTGVETWSSLGHYEYMGTMWYRARLRLAEAQGKEGARVFLWISAAAGEIEVFVNGRRCPAVDGEGNRSSAFSGYARPAHFDITDALRDSGDDSLAVRARRSTLD